MIRQRIIPAHNIAWDKPQPEPLAPRWLHYWAWLTVLLTVPLLLFGAEVTTKGAGMADPDALSHVREPWIFLRLWFEGTIFERGLLFVIEHGHRFAGQVVGISTIVLAIGLLFGASRWWLRLLGPAALLAVIGQGVLGIFRVRLHALFGDEFALVHGLTAQLVFALLLSIAVLASRFWVMPNKSEELLCNKLLQRLSRLTWIAVFAQLLLGGLVRHNAWMAAGRLHQLTAFVVVALAVWLLRELLVRRDLYRRERFAGCFLGMLLIAQIGLGLESWLIRFPAENIPGSAQALPLIADFTIVRSLHYVTGSLVFATLTVITLWSHRSAMRQTAPSPSAPVSHNRLEGVL